MKINSIGKSLKIIDLLSRYPEGRSLTEIANNIGIPKSTAHHIIQSFIPEEYIYQNQETKKYSLGYKFLEISKTILDNIDVRKIAHKYLRHLQEECKETVNLTILRGGKVVYIDKIDTPGSLLLSTHIGFTVDPHATAVGKILLSELPQADVKELYKDRPLAKYGKNTITDMDALLEELNKVKTNGYATDDEEFCTGIRCVAAPITAGGSVVAATSISGSIFSLTPVRINRDIVGMVMKTAEKISAEMKW